MTINYLEEIDRMIAKREAEANSPELIKMKYEFQQRVEEFYTFWKQLEKANFRHGNFKEVLLKPCSDIKEYKAVFTLHNVNGINVSKFLIQITFEFCEEGLIEYRNSAFNHSRCNTRDMKHIIKLVSEFISKAYIRG